MPSAAEGGLKLKRLGRTMLDVTNVGLGTMAFGGRVDEPAAFAMMDTAYAAGVRFIDTADVYPPPGTPDVRGRAEQMIGSWIKRRDVRSEIVLATKVGKSTGNSLEDGGLSRGHILRACDDSLRRLQTDWIDLYVAHVPDTTIDIGETLAAFGELVQLGKVRSAGCSNFPPALLVNALWTSQTSGLTRFDSLQAPYNMLARDIERQYIPLCATYEVGVVAHSPLAGGLLSDRQARHSTARRLRLLQQVAAHHGRSLTHIALGWVTSHPAIASALLGASQPDQLEDSLKGVDLPLDDDLRRACEAVLVAEPRTMQC